ncbi:MAG: hypothetical protein JXR36_06230 [Bacteroidales bacterium]|nr:hypothetical protein [Bacteroidales bacterium]
MKNYLKIFISFLFISCASTTFQKSEFRVYVGKAEWTKEEIEICEYAISNIKGMDTTKLVFSKTNIPGQGQAQPLFRTMFRKSCNRTYIVRVQECNDKNSLCFGILPDSAKVGLVGHELTHIDDYKSKGFFKMIGMGVMYSISPKYKRKVEYETDSLTIVNNMGKETLIFSEYISQTKLAKKRYLRKIRKFYISSEDIERIMKNIP